ncbi:MAG: MFS transporter [Candidatus Jordarchaeum sp.]|uniref:MFS transporter n=1 Tax=Candidatus Jordarchaeum sp. TaxID=2823881 RepID=UPI00404A5118
MAKKEKGKTEKKEKGKTRSLVTLGSAFFTYNADVQAFPVYYTSMGRDLGTSRAALGFIDTTRGALQAFLTPFWGFLADRYSRKKVLIIGCLIWGIATILLSLAGDYTTLALLRIVTALGLATMVPTGFSLIADMYPMESRGKYYAVYGAIGIVGLMLIIPILGFIDAPSLTGGLESDLYRLALYQAVYPDTMLILRNLLQLDALAKSTLYNGVWRNGFIVMGAISIGVAGLVTLLVKEPPRGAAEKELKGVVTEETTEKYKIKRSAFREILRNRTMLVIIGQGIMGYFPYVVLQFWFIHWFETARQIPPFQATIIFAILVMGSALGNLVGGLLGDRMEKRSPAKGRIMIAQISTFSGIPLVLLILFVRMDLLLYISVAFFTAIMMSWGGVGAVEPIVSAVNKPEARSTAWALEQMFEQGFAAFGVVLTGWIADNINLGVSGIAMQWISPYLNYWLYFADVGFLLYILWLSGESLTLAMALTVSIPWTFCVIIWTLAYRTYYRDKSRIQQFLDQRRKEITKK